MSISQIILATEKDVSIQPMSSKKFEGWRIRYHSQPCGHVKFKPAMDVIFKSHVTIDFHIPIRYRNRHIGRIALMKAMEISKHSIFVAHLRTSNIASKKALSSLGFKEVQGFAQICMVFHKS